MSKARIMLAAVALNALAPSNGAIAEDSIKAPGPIGAPAGSGAFKAIAEARADAPGYTIYRPAQMPAGRLPLVLWGNGACRDNGLSVSHFLREIASHGYIVIANGAPRSEGPVLDRLPELNGPPLPSPSGPAAPPRSTPDQTSVAQLLAGIAWADKANARRGDTLFRHVDTKRVAVMGHSCGGLQAIAAATDPRIKAVIAFDSGVYNRAGTGMSGVRVTKDDLAKLHTPIAYFIGGPSDIAYPNAMDDAERIKHVPVFVGNLPVNHGGTFQLANGGDWARAGTAWLNWQIKGDARAGTWFVGPGCVLCTSYGWSIVRKNFPDKP